MVVEEEEKKIQPYLVAVHWWPLIVRRRSPLPGGQKCEEKNSSSIALKIVGDEEIEIGRTKLNLLSKRREKIEIEIWIYDGCRCMIRDGEGEKGWGRRERMGKERKERERGYCVISTFSCIYDVFGYIYWMFILNF
ncbi:unnamed protein product [Cuscuta europaea]|uniref:Uncharacterized protein n=1 Tax=Cuscuta europaea TaxID=41803 RepID=A0A9P1EFQ3_CUSEU|nr:unnamed protein product [Cuscuta europaea]